jgi:hypothetical protein
MANTEFVVRLEGIDLPKDQRDRINKALQRALVHELADVDLGGQAAIRIPREWYGIWIEKFKGGGLPNVKVDVQR